MTTAVRTFCRQATRKPGERLNVLTCATHERAQSLLKHVNADFYLWWSTGIKKWNFKFGPLPQNHHILDYSKEFDQLPLDLDFDVILTQSIQGQHQTMAQLARQMQVPLLRIEHTTPYIGIWPEQYIQQLKIAGKAHKTVFISKFSRNAWGYSEDEAEVMTHAVETNIFCPDNSVPKKKHVLYVANDLINRDVPCGYRHWEQVTKDLPRKIVGDTPGLSSPAKDVDELVNFYREAQVFVCTTQFSPIPTVVLESMACGTPVVAFNNCALPEYIEHNVNGMLARDVVEMRGYLTYLLDHPEECERLGKAARQTILEKCNLQDYTNRWNNLLERTAKITNIGV